MAIRALLLGLRLIPDAADLVADCVPDMVYALPDGHGEVVDRGLDGCGT